MRLLLLLLVWTGTVTYHAHALAKRRAPSSARSYRHQRVRACGAQVNGPPPNRTALGARDVPAAAHIRTVRLRSDARVIAPVSAHTKQPLAYLTTTCYDYTRSTQVSRTRSPTTRPEPEPERVRDARRARVWRCFMFVANIWWHR